MARTEFGLALSEKFSTKICSVRIVTASQITQNDASLRKNSKRLNYYRKSVSLKSEFSCWNARARARVQFELELSDLSLVDRDAIVSCRR